MWITTSATTETFFSKPIIDLSLFWVVQCLIGLLNFGKLNYLWHYFLCIAALIWMILFSKLEECFLNFGLRGLFVDAQNIIITLGVGLVVIV